MVGRESRGRDSPMRVSRTGSHIDQSAVPRGSCRPTNASRVTDKASTWDFRSLPMIPALELSWRDPFGPIIDTRRN